MKSRYTKAFFYSTIVVLIIGITFIFASMPSKSMALGKTQYKVVRITSADAAYIENVINPIASQGWELVTMDGSFLIFKK